MTVIEGLWCVSTLMCGFSVIGMLYVYRSMERSMEVLTRTLHEMTLSTRSNYGQGVQRVAEDTKVEQ